MRLDVFNSDFKYPVINAPPHAAKNMLEIIHHKIDDCGFGGIHGGNELAISSN